MGKRLLVCVFGRHLVMATTVRFQADFSNNLVSVQTPSAARRRPSIAPFHSYPKSLIAAEGKVIWLLLTEKHQTCNKGFTIFYCQQSNSNTFNLRRIVFMMFLNMQLCS
jgi:hypothetical protein